MYKIISSVVLMMLVSGATVLSGCGIPESDYVQLEEQYKNKEAECSDYLRQIEELKNVKTEIGYFDTRVDVENWLENMPKPTRESADVDEWFAYALYYQTMALESGYIISVSYTYSEDGTTVLVTCDVITTDGVIYFFNPDDAILEDTGIRIPLEDYNFNNLWNNVTY